MGLLEHAQVLAWNPPHFNCARHIPPPDCFPVPGLLGLQIDNVSRVHLRNVAAEGPEVGPFEHDLIDVKGDQPRWQRTPQEVVSVTTQRLRQIRHRRPDLPESDRKPGKLKTNPGTPREWTWARFPGLEDADLTRSGIDQDQKGYLLAASTKLKRHFKRDHAAEGMAPQEIGANRLDRLQRLNVERRDIGNRGEADPLAVEMLGQSIKRLIRTQILTEPGLARLAAMDKEKRGPGSGCLDRNQRGGQFVAQPEPARESSKWHRVGTRFPLQSGASEPSIVGLQTLLKPPNTNWTSVD